MTELQNIRIEEIEESPFNPRRFFDEAELDELADSIREQGVLEPVIVRPRAREPRAAGVFYPWQLVCGARRLRAARRAGLPTIPAIVKELNDAQVVEVQVVENIQRSSMTPLEEAAAFDAMLAGECQRVEEVSARVGRTVGYVRSRLRLLDLEPSAAALLERGTIAIESALLLAQTPTAQQREVAETIARGSWRFRAGTPWTRAAVAELIKRASRQIQLAVWREPDGKGDVEGMPACANCHKRTGTQRALLAELDGEDACLDADCWRSKEAAFLESWRTAGGDVLEKFDRYAPTGSEAWRMDDDADGLPGAADDETVTEYLNRIGIADCSKRLLVDDDTLEFVVTPIDVKTALDVAHPELAAQLVDACIAQRAKLPTSNPPSAATPSRDQLDLGKPSTDAPAANARPEDEAAKREARLSAQANANAQQRIGAMVAEAASEAWPPKTALDEVAWWAGVCRVLLQVTSITAADRVSQRRELPRATGGVWAEKQAVEAFISTTLDASTLRGLAAELLVSVAHVECLAAGTEPHFGVPALLGALGIVPRQVVLGARRELEQEEASAAKTASKKASKKARAARDARDGAAL